MSFWHSPHESCSTACSCKPFRVMPQAVPQADTACQFPDPCPACVPRWDADLAGFLKALVKYWGKRLVSERSPGDPSASQGALAEGRAQLTDSMNQQLADVVIQLASRAQYAKVGTLWIEAACTVRSEHHADNA